MKIKNSQRRDREIELLGIMDTSEDAAFTVFSELARDTFEVPLSGISFITSKRHWIKSFTGNMPRNIPIEHSFCAKVADSESGFLYIEDASVHPEFKDNPLVTKKDGVKFYAGAVIRSNSGTPLGSLCIIDSVPRSYDDHKMKLLVKMAEGVSTSIALHTAARLLNDIKTQDTLTGLKKSEDIKNIIKNMSMRGESFTVISINVDKFSTINGLFGHASGDIVLKEIARRLMFAAEVSGIKPIVSRGEEDNFLILLGGISNIQGAEQTAERIQQSMKRKFMISNQRISITVSLGIAVSTDIRGLDIISVVDSALSASKRAGGNCVSIAGNDEVPGKQYVADMLKKALLKPGEEPFIFFYQPLFNTEKGSLLGFEALVRWPTKFGIVSPIDFIPLAEADGSIVQIDRWGLRKACYEAMKWPSNLSVGVNISSAGFVTGDLVGDVQKALLDSGLEPSRLKIELTETVLMPHVVKVNDVMNKLHDIGVKLVLDDFGCGHASLGYVRDYPFDTIKIDRSFMRDIVSDRKSRSVLHAIIELGMNLGVETVAEGVETEEQMNIMKEEGVSSVQGYFCGRPLSESDALLFASSFIVQSPNAR